MNINTRNIVFILFLFLVDLSLAQVDTANDKIKKISLASEGQISLGYEYGFLPFLVSTSPPQQNFKTEGFLGVNVFSLPFKASYYYSSLGSISGLNNHFSFKFDAQQYLMDKKEKLFEEKMNRLEKIDSLNLEKQLLKKKLDYLYLLDQGKIGLPEVSNLGRFDTSVFNNDTIENLQINSSYKDSSDISYPNINVPNPNMANEDSLKVQIQKYQNLISTYEEQIEKYKDFNSKKSDTLHNYNLNPKKNIERLLEGVKAFEIGLTYPNYSKFLIARVPIRGINTEFQGEKFSIWRSYILWCLF